MRILVASRYIHPGVSGGWTTVMDLLERDHEVAFLLAAPGVEEGYCEGTRVYTVPRMARSTGPWPFGNRIREAFSHRSLHRCIRLAMARHDARLVLCLDELMARACCDAGVDYAVRFHCHPGILDPAEYSRVLRGALFATGTEEGIPGTVFIPHSIDHERFDYSEPRDALAAVMPTSLVDAEDPLLFVRGVELSSLSGTIVGDGPMRREVETACAGTSGRVRFRGPVTRSRLPGLLADHQIGVACLREGWHTTYQMKVTEYQLAGLFPLVQPWSELARVRPDLTRTFTTAEELAGQLDWAAANWPDTLSLRRRNREFALDSYGIEKAREQFAGLLRSSLGGSSASR